MHEIDLTKFTLIELYAVLLKVFGEGEGQTAIATVEKIPVGVNRLEFARDFVRALLTGDAKHLDKRMQQKFVPVDVQTFVENDYFLDSKNILYPKVLECLIEMNNGAYQEAVLTGAIGCLPADTEFLTPTGWERMDAYTPDMLVAEYDPLTHRAVFRHPVSYVVKPATWFHRVHSKYGIDMAVSPGHRVLFRNTRGALRVISGDGLVRRCEENDNGFCGKILTTFNPPLRAGINLSHAQLRVQVAVQAHASFDHRESSTTCGISVKKVSKQERLRELLTAAGITCNERVPLAKEGYVKFTFKAPLRSKDFNWAWEATPDQLKVITGEVLHWNGSISSNRYATTSKEAADFIQYAFTCTGYRSAISCSPNFSSLCKGTPKLLYIVGSTPRIEPSLQSRSGGLVSKIPSLDGKMYCFETKTKFFVARYNGKVFITGNTGKTTLALYSTAYQLYLLSSYLNPHRVFGLDPSSEIMVVFQSINATLSKTVDYMRFKTMVESSQYFRESFAFDKGILSELRFPNRIIVKPITGEETGAIGQNVIGGVIDEMNFMALVENSKSSMDNAVYDQATALYDSIALRRKSRFMIRGKLPGLLCLVSSKRYPGQFTDKKEAEAKLEIERTGKTTIYIYDKREWDVKPAERFSGKWFHIFIGDESRRPRILQPKETVPDEDRHLAMAIPEEYRTNFEADIMKALRDVAGVSTLATHPFIQDRASVAKAQRDHHLIFTRETVDFQDLKLGIRKAQFFEPDRPRFVHCDLAISGDSAGFAVGCVTEFTTAKGGGWMPKIFIDGLLEIKPPKNGEILLYKIREVVTTLKSLGLNIQWVTFDQFQSIDSQQLLKQAGFTVGLQSVDKTTGPYDFVKSALYDGRLSLPRHAKCALELVSLEKDTKKNKIDHPPHSSKDVSDALAGVVYGLTMRRQTWTDFDISLGEIPPELLDILKKDKLKVAEPA